MPSMKSAGWVLVCLFVGCSGSEISGYPETSGTEPEASNASGAPCVLMPEAHAPSAATCYRVTAGAGNVLAACESGPPPTDVLTVPYGPGVAVEAFTVGAGGCYRWHACGSSAAPTVSPCP